ncbi:hypothetical protein ACE6H2_008921 [Prunus campanulata]
MTAQWHESISDEKRVERIFWKPHTETSATHLGVLDGDLNYRGGGGGFSSHGNGMVHSTSKCYKN